MQNCLLKNSNSVITKIHGKYYDLSNFQHPGGIVPKLLIHEQDATCLFESYHPVSDKRKIEKILSKYEVTGNHLTNTQDIYDFESHKDCPFTNELKKEVHEYFKKKSITQGCSIVKATKATKGKLLETCILFLLTALSAILYIQHNVISLLLLPLFYYLFAVNTYHDMSHFSFFENKKLENTLISFFFFYRPPYGWMNDHTLHHHSYPNIRRAMQAGLISKKCVSKVFTPVYNKIKNTKTNIWYKIFFSSTLEDKVLFERNTNSTFIFQTIVYVCIRALFFKIGFIDNILHYGPCAALIYTLVPLLVFFLLYNAFEIPNHKHAKNIRYKNNYWIHQTITSHNFCTGSYLFRLLSGGLNYQIEHHLFPSVNSCHLPHISPIVQDVCRKHNIPYYNSNSWPEVLLDGISYLKGRSKIKPTHCHKKST